MKIERVYNISYLDLREEYFGHIRKRLEEALQNNKILFDKPLLWSSYEWFWGTCVCSGIDHEIACVAISIATGLRAFASPLMKATPDFDIFQKEMYEIINDIDSRYTEYLNKFICDKLYNSAFLYYDGRLTFFQELLFKGSNKLKWIHSIKFKIFHWLFDEPVIKPVY